MAYTRLSDVYNPVTFDPAVFQAALAKQKVLNSPGLALDGGMSADMNSRGFLFTAPTYYNLADSNVAAWVPDDDITHIATPEKMSFFQSAWLRLARNNGWAAADVVTDLTGVDPIAVAAAQYGGKVAKNREVALMNILKGIMNTTVAGTTLFKKIGSETNAGNNAGTKFNIDSLIDAMIAAQGDNYDPSGLTMFVHSKVYGQMIKDDILDDVKPSQANLFPTAMGGINVVVTNSVPSRAGTTDAAAVNYTTYLMRNGAIRYGIGAAKNPTALARTEDTGYSGGHETLWVRDVIGFAPAGFSYTGGTNAASPTITDAQLAVPGNWTKVLADEQIPIFALESNAG